MAGEKRRQKPDEVVRVLREHDIPYKTVTAMIEEGIETIPGAVLAEDNCLIKGSSTLLISEETGAKNEFLLSFACQGMIDGDSVVYAHSKRSPAKIRDAMQGADNTRIIDLRQGIPTGEQVDRIVEEGGRLVVPPNLILFRVGVVKAVKSFPKKSHKRVVIDAYSDLSKYYSWDGISEFLPQQIEGFRKWNCTSIFTIDPTKIPARILEKLKRIFDNVLIGHRVVLHIEKLGESKRY